MRIEARSLGKRFGALTALRDVSFQVPSGRRVALVGPNGSGKSTVNRVLMGLLRHEGEVRLDGVSPLADRVGVARRIAYVPQQAPNLGASAAELLAALTQLRDLDPGRLAKLADGLHLDLAAVGPRPFRSLSGGMRQKLLISAALAGDASLFVLDEPTGSLDPRSRERFFALFEEASAGATVLLCSHRLEEIRHLVDYVLVLEEGRLVYDGPADAFLATTALARLELRVADPSAEAWLGTRGFRRGAGGWWVRTVARGEKPRWLQEACAALGDRMLDVALRDLEGMDFEAPPGAGPRGA